MCGIGGFCLHPEDRDIDVRSLTDNLLLQIESRGGDATGAAWFDEGSSRLKTVKSNVGAERFIDADGTQALGEDGARQAILHTRFATQGDPADPANNHPFYSGRIVAVHNGSVGNDWKVFQRLRNVERLGQVDSEAIAAVLDQSPLPPWASLDVLSGGIATAWFDRDDIRDLHLARVRTSPLWWAQNVAGSFFFASTKELLLDALANASVTAETFGEFKEGTYCRVRAGVVHDYMTMDKVDAERERLILGPQPPDIKPIRGVKVLGHYGGGTFTPLPIEEQPEGVTEEHMEEAAKPYWQTQRPLTPPALPAGRSASVTSSVQGVRSLADLQAEFSD